MRRDFLCNRTTLLRFVAPAMLRVDFTHSMWQTTQAEARGWILASVLADLLALWLTGEFNWWYLGLALVTPLSIWWLPTRLALAAATLYCAQALGSIVLVTGMEALLAPKMLIQGITALWQLWCMLALVVLLVRYIRTPKAALAG